MNSENIKPNLNGLYDLSTIKLLVHNDSKQLNKFISVFIKTMRKNISALKEAAIAGDRSQIEFFCHTIKGSSGQLNVTRLAELAFELEGMSKDVELDKINLKIEVLLGIYEEVDKKLNEELLGL